MRNTSPGYTSKGGSGTEEDFVLTDFEGTRFNESKDNFDYVGCSYQEV